MRFDKLIFIRTFFILKSIFRIKNIAHTHEDDVFDTLIFITLFVLKYTYQSMCLRKRPVFGLGQMKVNIKNIAGT